MRGLYTIRVVKLIVFGATGGTGRELVAQGVAAGHAVTAFVRDPAGLDAPGAAAITGDALDPAAVGAAIRGHDAVLSALGTRPWRHVDICSRGTAAIAAGMAATGVRRLVAMSSLGVGDSRLGGIARLGAVVLRRSLADKQRMEDELAATALDWIVVRPGMLTGGAPRGGWRTATDGSLTGGRIARADVAAFMLQQLAAETWLRQRPVLVW
jgi:putative NADH-flavin reductase